MADELVTNGGAKWMIDILAQQISPDDVDIVLLTDTTPFALTDVPADHTPTVLTGGGPVTLGTANWSTSVSAGTAFAVSTLISWSFAAYAGGTTIEQYMVVDSSTGAILIWGGVLPTPYAVPSGGGVFELVITWPLNQCPEGP